MENFQLMNYIRQNDYQRRIELIENNVAIIRTIGSTANNNV